MLWNAKFYHHFSGFESILPVWHQIESHFINSMPSPEDYNRHFPNQFNHFICQKEALDYEKKVVEERSIPTRLNNWHDFFNNLTWLSFPLIKQALVERSVNIRQNKLGTTQRSPQQSLLAHFDECGMLLCSTDSSYFDLVKSFSWKLLFQENQLLNHVFPLVVGHGLMEKALKPYIGMTAKVIFVHVKPDFINFSLEKKIRLLDNKISTYIMSQQLPHSPQSLCPFPLLGWPNWFDLQDDNFYNNTGYFRLERRLKVKLACYAEC